MKRMKLLILLGLLLLTSTVLYGCKTERPIVKNNLEHEEHPEEIEEVNDDVITIEAMDFTQNIPYKKNQSLTNPEPMVLFMGNSMIYYNDLPSIFYNLSFSGGFNPHVYELTEGAYLLNYFADPTDELGMEFYSAVKEYNWDYVILQEQSATATIMAEEYMFPAARILDSLIGEADAQTVFFMTWAYYEGYTGELLGKNLDVTREEMQTLMANNYIEIANELDALLAPAGIAFMRSLRDYPEIELWDEDGSHTTLEGSYLAACVIYATLFNSSPVGLDFIMEIEPDTALKLQTVAAQTIGF